MVYHLFTFCILYLNNHFNWVIPCLHVDSVQEAHRSISRVPVPAAPWRVPRHCHWSLLDIQGHPKHHLIKWDWTGNIQRSTKLHVGDVHLLWSSLITHGKLFLISKVLSCIQFLQKEPRTQVWARWMLLFADLKCIILHLTCECIVPRWKHVNLRGALVCCLVGFCRWEMDHFSHPFKTLRRVRKARAEQPPESSQVDLESRLTVLLLRSSVPFQFA